MKKRGDGEVREYPGIPKNVIMATVFTQRIEIIPLLGGTQAIIRALCLR